jgi:hypothetical protein
MTHRSFRPFALIVVLGSALVAAASAVIALIEPILRIAFPASAPQLVPASAFSTPAILGRDETNAFLLRRASRDAGRRRGHWSMASPQLAA